MLVAILTVGHMVSHVIDNGKVLGLYACTEVSVYKV